MELFTCVLLCLISFAQHDSLQPITLFHVFKTILICVSFQDTFDKERQKDSGARDREMQQLDSELSSTRNQLNQVQDE